MVFSKHSVLMGFILLSNSALLYPAYYIFASLVVYQNKYIADTSHNISTVYRNQSAVDNDINLHYSILEFNIIAGLPALIVILPGYYVGTIIDGHGFKIVIVVCTVLPVVSEVFLNLAVRARMWHSSSVLLTLVGSTLRCFAYVVIYSVQMYVSKRWFSGKLLGFSIGACMTVSSFGSLLAYYGNLAIMQSIGFEMSMWAGVPITMIATIFGIMLVVCDYIGEKSGYEFQKQSLKLDLSFKSLRTYDGRFWLLSVIAFLNVLIFDSIIVNSNGSLTSLFGISAQHAAALTGSTYIVKQVICPIAGLIGGRFDIYGVIGAFGCLCYVTAILLLHFAIGPPVIIPVSIGLGFGTILVSMSSVVSDLVPFERLGTASSIMCTIMNTGLAGNVLVGAITGFASSNVESWSLIIQFSLCAIALQAVLYIWLMIWDQRSNETWWFRGRGEKSESQKLLQNTS